LAGKEFMLMEVVSSGCFYDTFLYRIFQIFPIIGSDQNHFVPVLKSDLNSVISADIKKNAVGHARGVMKKPIQK